MATSSGILISSLSEDAENELLKELQEKLDKLETREKEVSDQHSGKEVEKESILRQIRVDRRSTSNDIKELQFAKVRREHKKLEAPKVSFGSKQKGEMLFAGKYSHSNDRKMQMKAFLSFFATYKTRLLFFVNFQIKTFVLKMVSFARFSLN